MKRGEVARNVTRGAFFLGLEKGISSVSTLAYMALISRWLGPTKYGMFTLAFSIVSLTGALTGNFEVYLERFAAEYQVRDRLRTLGRAFTLTMGLKFVLALLASGVLVVMAPWFVERYRLPELLFLLPLLTGFMVADGIATTGRSLLFGLQHFGWVSALSLIFSIGRAVLVGLLWWSRHGLSSLAIGMSLLAVVQALAFGIAAFVTLARRRGARETTAGPEPAVEPGLLRQMLAYCLPLYGANLSFLSGQNVGTLVLGIFVAPTLLGYFRFAFTTVERFVEVVYTLPRALLPSLTEIVAREDREKLMNVFEQAFRIVQVVACIASFGLFVYAREIVLLVGSPLFEPAVPLLRVLALVPIVRTAQQPLTMLFQALRRPGYVLALALLKLAVEIGGYFLLLRAFAVAGACWANLGGALAAFTGALVLARVALPEGAGARVGVVLRSTALMAPLLVAALAADRWLGLRAALAVRLALLVPALLGVFALGLVNRYDLEKVASLPLSVGWLARFRDQFVAGAGRLVRLFEPRRAA